MLLTATTHVSFPGLGIGEFSLDRVAFTIFGRNIYWYAIIITLGMVTAFLYAYYRSRREGIILDDLIDLTLATIIFGIVGARLYYVLTTLDTGNYKNFKDVIAIWNGGLAIYGGIIAGAIALICVSRKKKINWIKVLDLAAPGVMIAQAMGRWGNFVNGEAYGYVVSESSPLYMFRMGLVSQYTGSEKFYYHPTFLYESAWNVLGFVIINIFYSKKKFNGQIALSYLAWYGFGRMFIEGLRTDSLYVGSFRVSQVVGFVCFAVCSVLFVLGLIFEKKGMLVGKFGGLLEVSWAEPGWDKKSDGNGYSDDNDDHDDDDDSDDRDDDDGNGDDNYNYNYDNNDRYPKW